jgi:putative tricarboxylic transport membrane protein
LPDVPGQDFGPGFFPIILGAGLAIFGAAYAVNALRGVSPALAGPPPEPVSDEIETAPEKPFIGALLWLVLGLVAIVQLWEPVGFVPLLTAYLAGFMFLIGVSAWQALLLAGGTTIAAHLVFVRVMMVPLPSGLTAAIGL